MFGEVVSCRARLLLYMIYPPLLFSGLNYRSRLSETDFLTETKGEMISTEAGISKDSMLTFKLKGGFANDIDLFGMDNCCPALHLA
jgi:hypothetical protein